MQYQLRHVAAYRSISHSYKTTIFYSARRWIHQRSCTYFKPLGFQQLLFYRVTFHGLRSVAFLRNINSWSQATNRIHMHSIRYILFTNVDDPPFPEDNVRFASRTWPWFNETFRWGMLKSSLQMSMWFPVEDRACRAVYYLQSRWTR